MKRECAKENRAPREKVILVQWFSTSFNDRSVKIVQIFRSDNCVVVSNINEL